MKLYQLPDDRDQLEQELQDQKYNTELELLLTMESNDGDDGQEQSAAAKMRRTSTRIKTPVIPIGTTVAEIPVKKTRKRKNSQGKSQKRQRKRKTSSSNSASKCQSTSNGIYSSFDDDDDQDQYHPNVNNGASNTYRTQVDSSMSSFLDDSYDDDDDDNSRQRYYSNGGDNNNNNNNNNSSMMITFPNTSINSSIFSKNPVSNNRNFVPCTASNYQKSHNEEEGDSSSSNNKPNANFVQPTISASGADSSVKPTKKKGPQSMGADETKKTAIATTTTTPKQSDLQINLIEEDLDFFIRPQLPHLSHSQFLVPESSKLVASKIRSPYPTPLASLLSICPPPPQQQSLNIGSLSSPSTSSAPSVKPTVQATTTVQKPIATTVKPKRKRAPRKPAQSQATNKGNNNNQFKSSKTTTKSDPKQKKNDQNKVNTSGSTKYTKLAHTPSTSGLVEPVSSLARTINSAISSSAFVPLLSSSLSQPTQPSLLVSFQQPAVPLPPLPIEPVKYPVKLAIHRSRVVGPVVRIDKQQSSSTGNNKQRSTKSKSAKQQQKSKNSPTDSSNNNADSIQYLLVNKLSEDTSSATGSGNAGGGGGASVNRVKKHLSQRSTVAESSVEGWKCILCHQKPLAKFLGDLYGPYFVQLSSPLNFQLSQSLGDNSSNQESSKKSRQSGCSMPSSPISAEVWVHEDCIVWSNVYAIGSKICNLENAIQESRNTNCSYCRHSGATLACFVKDCFYSALHFPCAKEMKCYFNEDNFTLFCPDHFVQLQQQQSQAESRDPTQSSTDTITTNQSPAVNAAAIASCSTARSKMF